MKTLCYKFVFCYKGLLYNDGFIILEIGDDGKLAKIEGLLTDEYVEAKITEDNMEIIIYSRNCEGNLQEFFSLEGELEEFTFPLNVTLKGDNNHIIVLKTTEKITGNVKKLKERINKFKENNVFEKERD